jgi:hypothetical protein
MSRTVTEALSGTFTLRVYDDGRHELFLSSPIGSVTVGLSAADVGLSEAMFGEQVSVEVPG